MDSLLKTFENWVTTKIDERLALTGYTRSDELIAKDNELGLLQRDCLDLVDKRIDLLDAKTNAVLAGVSVKFQQLNDVQNTMNENTKAVESLENRFEDLEQQCSEAVTRFEIFDINDHVDFEEAVIEQIERLDLTDYIDHGRITAEITESFKISISAQLERKS